MSVNGSEPDGELVAIEVPQYGIIVEDDATGTPYIGLQVLTSGSMYRGFLCMPENADPVARKFGQMIMQAGREGRKRQGKANLIVPTGGEVNAIRKTKGG